MRLIFFKTVPTDDRGENHEGARDRARFATRPAVDVAVNPDHAAAVDVAYLRIGGSVIGRDAVTEVDVTRIRLASGGWLLVQGTVREVVKKLYGGG